jgi:ribose transport system substrate-binding protein
MSQELKIAVLPRSSFFRFWKVFCAGVKQAESDLLGAGIPLAVQCDAPVHDDDWRLQADILEKFVRQDVHGIVIAPCHSQELVGPVEAAAKANIPTVVVDSPLETARMISFVGTDNRKAGTLAAHHMGEYLDGRGSALVLRYQKGSRSTEEREDSFIQHMRQAYPEVAIISPEEYTGSTRDSARRLSERLLAQYGSRLQAVFTPNEPSTAGMLMALQSSSLVDTVKLFGFDASDLYMDFVRRGKIQAVVVQNPFRMGELSVKTLVDRLQGRTVPATIDTGATLVTPNNIDELGIQLLLNPETRNASLSS